VNRCARTELLDARRQHFDIRCGCEKFEKTRKLCAVPWLAECVAHFGQNPVGRDKRAWWPAREFQGARVEIVRRVQKGDKAGRVGKKPLSLLRSAVKVVVVVLREVRRKTFRGARNFKQCRTPAHRYVSRLGAILPLHFSEAIFDFKQLLRSQSLKLFNDFPCTHTQDGYHQTPHRKSRI